MKDNIDVTQCDESMLYFVIDNLGYVMWWMRHESAKGRFEDASDEWYSGKQKELEDAVRQTTRFGVDAPIVDNGPSPEYRLWYRWWDAWKKNMTDDEWDVINAMISNGETAGLRPPGDWRPE